MPPTRRDQILQELSRRRDMLAPRQQQILQELSRRGVLEADTPEVTKKLEEQEIQTLEPVLPSGVSPEDFDRIKRTGLTPGTSVQFAGVSIATENERRRLKGIEPLNSKQQEARLRVFQQQAGVPGSEIKDEFQVQQEKQRTERSTTFSGRLQSAGTGALANIGGTGTDILGVFAPETALKLSEEFRTILNPDGSRAGKAGALLGELAKVATFAKTGPAGLAAIFGAQGVGGVRQEVAQLRQQGQDISGAQEATTAGLVGGTEAASGFISGLVFGSLGKTLQKLNPITRVGLLQGKEVAVRSVVKNSLKALADIIAEGAEEGVTQLITNKIRQGIKPELAITEGVLEAAATGLLLAPFGAAGSQSSLLGRSQVDTEAQTAPEVETSQEAVQAPTEKTPVVSRETPVDDTQTALPITDDTQTTSDVSMESENVDTSRQRVDTGDISQIAEPTPVDDSGTPQAEETPAQTIQRTAGERSPEGTTSARKVDIEANREAMNNLLLDQSDVRTWEEAQAIAQEQNIPEQSMKLAREIKTVPRILSDIETAGVTQRVVAVIAEHNTLTEQLDNANPVEAKLLDAELQRLEQDHAELTEAQRISGTEGGRALNAIKLMLNQQFELVSVLGRAKRAKGKDLTPADRTRITKLTKEIQRLNKRLETLKNQPPSRSDTVNRTRNKQLEKLIFEKAQVQGRINRVVENLKPRTWTEIAIREPLSIMRALKSSFDVSAVGRQAGLATIGNPLRAAKNLGPMFKAMASERAQFKINERIKNDPNFEFAKRAGLRITDTSVGASLSQKEENYRSRLADKIPGVRASDRAFSTFLNLMRMDGFNAMTASLARNGEATAAEAVIIADTVNNFTGFGGLADMKKSSKILNTVFWSPSLQLARFQTLVTRPVEVLTGRRKGGQKISPRVRKLIAKEYGKTLLGLTVLLALGKLAGFEIEENPQSSDFLKLKAGNTRIDIGAGITQFLVLGARTLTGETKSPTSGKIRPIRGADLPFGQDDAADVFFRFTRSKFTPGLGLAIDMMAGQNVIGEKVDVTTPAGAGKVVLQGLAPLSATEVFESFREQDVPGALGLSAMTIFGVGVQNFAPKKKGRRLD